MNQSRYADFRSYLDTVPVIETHIHYTSNAERFPDVLPLMLGYLKADLRVAAGPAQPDIIRYLADGTIPFKQRYDVFAGLYRKCANTAYAKAMVRGLSACWGIGDVSYASLCALNERLHERDQAFFLDTMRRLNVRAQVADIFESRFFAIMDGTDQDYTHLSKFAFPLPAFHRIYRGKDIEQITWLTGSRPVCLEDLVCAVERLLERANAWGAVCIKDQSAYFRSLDYGHPTQSQAEAAFNRLAAHPLAILSDEEGRALDDWLFQRYLRKAGQLDMPVQVHTGLQDRIALYDDRDGGDIRTVNAALLIPTLERHPQVRFDLFHANWPFMDEMLYLGKNFPNAYVDMCWAHSLDPVYSVELLKRAVMCMPQSKILGFGSDAFVMENGVGYLEQAKDNIARALTDLISDGWLDIEAAQQIALDWLYCNPKDFFAIE